MAVKRQQGVAAARGGHIPGTGQLGSVAANVRCHLPKIPGFGTCGQRHVVLGHIDDTRLVLNHFVRRPVRPIISGLASIQGAVGDGIGESRHVVHLGHGLTVACTCGTSVSVPPAGQPLHGPPGHSGIAFCHGWKKLLLVAPRDGTVLEHQAA